MRIFIFGAGASKGAQPDQTPNDLRAPLTNELFHPIYQGYANIIGLNMATMNVYRKEISGHAFFEDWLTEKWNEVKKKRQISTRDAQKGLCAQIAFYIWILLLNVSKLTYSNRFQSRDNNSYLTLMNKILVKDEQFGLINFNYDLLLDYAYKDSHKLVFHNIQDYLDNNYIKPHGSVNWLLSKRHDDRDIDTFHEENMDTKVRLATAINLMYKDSPIPLDGIVVKEPDHRDLYTIDDLLKSFEKQYFYPLMFLPLTSKEYSSISGFESKVVKRGIEIISSANEIYLIGYRANDDIIKNMLKYAPTRARLHVVGNSSAVEIMNSVLSWANHLERGAAYTGGFHHFAQDLTL